MLVLQVFGYGGYHKTEINQHILDMIDTLRPQITEKMAQTGYNGLPIYTPKAAMVQVVNGRNYKIELETATVEIYNHLDGKVELVNVESNRNVESQPEHMRQSGLSREHAKT